MEDGRWKNQEFKKEEGRWKMEDGKIKNLSRNQHLRNSIDNFEIHI
ncbi:hypothetical protein [Okeania sp. KiyG1]|nr:hypothetical protein [Okeania sp. KiyG1]